MTYWQKPEFLELEKAWYERLKESGFEDKEIKIGADMALQADWAVGHLSRSRSLLKEDYYLSLHQKLQEHKFARVTDYLILTLHAAGSKNKEIRDILKSLGYSRCRNSVCFVIRKYEVKWGLRTYQRKKLNLRDQKKPTP